MIIINHLEYLSFLHRRFLNNPLLVYSLQEKSYKKPFQQYDQPLYQEKHL